MDQQEKLAAKTKAQAETRGGRRTKPEDQGPPSVAEVKKLYANVMGRGVGGGDGLTTKQQARLGEQARGPQAIENEHAEGYDNDVPLDWRRGGGSKHAEGYPGFKATGIPAPAKGGGKNTGTGADCTKSPFSAAHKTWKD